MPSGSLATAAVATGPGTERQAPIHLPSPEVVEGSQMTAFSRELGRAVGRSFRGHDELHAFSVTEFRTFWTFFLDWSGLAWTGESEPVCTGERCEDAVFFPGLRLNYAASVLGPPGAFDDAQPAVTARGPGGACRRLSRGELRERVERLAHALLERGLAPGERVVAVVRNDAEAVVAALAVAAVGASFASAAPEMGAEAILDRFGPLAPRLLIAHLAPRPHDAGTPVSARVARIARGLPSLGAVIALDDAPLPDGVAPPVLRLEELVARPLQAPFRWRDFPFNQPLFIMFSSGTTGRPKCIVHGAGGTLLEHLKEHRLHGDLRPDDRLFFQTSCAWMMWNWQLSALAVGAGIVLNDGPAPDARTLWRIVAEEGVSVLGTGPAYLRLCEEAGLAPAREFDLASLRAILSTGSILHDRQYRWVRNHVKALPLQSISGGTDIIGCFMLGNPNLPVMEGEIQCPSLGLDVRAVPPPGECPDGVGELVCANPFPSRPLGFYGDRDGSRFHAAYFAQNLGLWTHGDLVEFTRSGGVRLHGRSDGVLKPRGIRVGPAEIYRVLQEFAEIREAMAVEQRLPAEFADGRIVLLLVLGEGAALDGQLTARLRRRLAERASAAHVPDVILRVDALPTTHSGKLSETAAADALNGRPPRNAEALRNPECLDALRDHPGLRPTAPPRLEAMPEAGLERQLQLLWEALFHCAPIGWRDDFFELGGNSLQAARLFAAIRERMGRDLPLTTLHLAPTIESLAAILRDPSWSPSARLIALRPGEGTPLFLVHSLAGTVTQLWALGRAMRCRAPVHAIQARGIEPGEQAHRRVEAMAADYLGAIRKVQPHGPYRLGGFSFGGLVAFEIARQLRQLGEEVEFLGLVDTAVHERFRSARRWLRYGLERPWREIARVFKAAPGRRLGYLADKAMVLLDRARMRLGQPPRRLDLVGDIIGEAHLPPGLRRVRGGANVAARHYRPGAFAGRITFFLAANSGSIDSLPAWRKAAKGGVEVHLTPGGHDDMILEPNVQALAAALDRCLDKAAGACAQTPARA